MTYMILDRLRSSILVKEDLIPDNGMPAALDVTLHLAFDGVVGLWGEIAVTDEREAEEALGVVDRETAEEGRSPAKKKKVSLFSPPSLSCLCLLSLLKGKKTRTTCYPPIMPHTHDPLILQPLAVKNI